MTESYIADILGLGTPELVIILVILVLLFGASKLPKLARSVGSSMKELRKGMQDETKQDKPAARSNKTEK